MRFCRSRSCGWHYWLLLSLICTISTNGPADAGGFITCISNYFENVNNVVVILVIHVHKGIGH